jgi:hypothetical protein
MYQTFPINSCCSLNEITGILVTPTLLGQLSFHYDSDKNNWSGQGITIQKKADGFFYGARIGRNRTRIIFLHELQNYISDYFNLFHHEKRTLNLLSNTSVNY